MKKLLVSLALFSLAFGVLLATPSVVSAATGTVPMARVSNGRLYFAGTAGDDQVYTLQADSSGTSWIISDFVPGVVAGTGCSPYDQYSVICGPASKVIAHLGDGDDFFAEDSFNATYYLPEIVYGGAGNDRFDGSAVKDQLFGQGGHDFFVTHDDAADVFSGGTGLDVLTYKVSGGPEGVSVTEDGVANDGHKGERDNVGADIERLFGTRYDDTMAIPQGHLLGSDGNDHLSLTSGGGSILGGSGADTLDAGPGGARVFGEKGNDSLNSANSVANNDDCGPGKKDTVTIDALDTTINCETMNGP